ncbi:SDR family oxidoreductase [Novosphingobium terrae]|uniref:SDR family oxidoreductase n=1 Tax=Novosphingobium terrae TaxID=2726189 RepID=UPI00197FC979|nr:SDR family oxidoreductase [Novosphingobium terrae]
MTIRSTALITGANKGIGLAIAHQLGAAGHTVWLGCRDAARGQTAADDLRHAGIDAHALTIDVSDDDSVGAAARRLEKEIGALDVLVNNAGISIGTPGPASEEQIDSIRAMFEVNTLGPLRVTQALLPLLRRSPAARIVMMSSGLGSLAETGDMAGLYWNVDHAGYCASKSALNMLTVKLAKELLAEGIKVNAADPGFTATDMNGHTGYRDVDQAAAVAVHLATLGPLGPTGGFFHDGHAVQNRHRW